MEDKRIGCNKYIIDTVMILAQVNRGEFENIERKKSPKNERGGTPPR